MNKIIFQSDYCELITNAGIKILFDKKDYDLVCKYIWSVDSKGYASAKVNGKTQRMHNLVMKHKDNTETDHINHNKLDNRRKNLRVCSCSENHMNMIIPKHNTSGYKGVCWDKSRSNYRAYIKLYQKQISLGRYSDKTSAALAYNKAALFYFGEYAKLNDVSA